MSGMYYHELPPNWMEPPVEPSIPQSSPLRFGLTGLGGYAGYACDRVLAESQRNDPPATLVAVCELEPERFPRRVEALRSQGVTVVRDFDALLNLPIEA